MTNISQGRYLVLLLLFLINIYDTKDVMTLRKNFHLEKFVESEELILHSVQLIHPKFPMKICVKMSIILAKKSNTYFTDQNAIISFFLLLYVRIELQALL